MKKIKFILPFLLLGAIIYSCNNDDDANASYPYAVRLTDAPGPYDEVNVDVQGVEVTGDGGKIVLLDLLKKFQVNQ